MVNLIEKISRVMPEHKGYTIKESLRNDDKIFRLTMVRIFASIRSLVDELTVELSYSGNFHLLKKMGKLAKEELSDIIGRLKFASYDYSKLFDVDSIDEKISTKLSHNDLGALGQADILFSIVGQLDNVLDSEEQTDQLFEQLEKSLELCNIYLDRRAKIIAGEE